ncbi:MAG: hypothetical protein LBC64_06265 [Fibromonadaceae bacterium]|jgi:hypothetical protein|nr:hypothetical protein [Fibromonadaceae bacterium]
MRTQLKKIVLAVGISLAMALTFSCSSDDGGNENPSGVIGGEARGGSREITEVYALKNITDNSFTFTYIDTIGGSEYCGLFGALKRESDIYDATINYIINNNALVWKYDYSRDGFQFGEDGLQFNGISNNLIGTWTREVKKYGDFENVTRAEFMGNELKITYDYCASDRMLLRYGEDRGNGWKIRNIDCETYEIYKGNEVITVKETSRLDVINDLSVTYKGKTCAFHISQLEKACSDAWEKYMEYLLQVAQVTNPAELAVELLEIYLDYLEENFYSNSEQIDEEFAECLANTIPYTEVPRGDYKGFLWGF